MRRRVGASRRRRRRVERDLGEEALARRETSRRCARAARGRAARACGVVVEARELRLVPRERRRRSRAASAASRERSDSHIATRPCQRCRRRGGTRTRASPSQRLGACSIASSRRARRRRTDAGHEPHGAKAGQPVARVVRPAQQRQHVLDVRGLEELEAAVLHEGNVAAGELELELRAVARRCGTAPPAP